MKKSTGDIVNVYIEVYSKTPEGDICLIGNEDHQMTMDEDEQFVGICYVATKDKKTKIDFPLSHESRANDQQEDRILERFQK